MYRGLLIADKPKGPTSHDVVEELRKKLKIRKIGHAGTLDPFATGVLIIGVGNATRLLEYMKDLRKTYRVKMKLGIITDTFDITGNVVEKEAAQSANLKSSTLCCRLLEAIGRCPLLIQRVNTKESGFTSSQELER